MSGVETYKMLVLGSGGAGKYLAWTMAKAGHRTAMVEQKWLGGWCPNVACLPSKNLIYSAKVAALAKRGAEFGLEMDSLAISMALQAQCMSSQAGHDPDCAWRAILPGQVQ